MGPMGEMAHRIAIGIAIGIGGRVRPHSGPTLDVISTCGPIAAGQLAQSYWYMSTRDSLHVATPAGHSSSGVGSTSGGTTLPASATAGPSCATSRATSCVSSCAASCAGTCALCCMASRPARCST